MLVGRSLDGRSELGRIRPLWDDVIDFCLPKQERSGVAICAALEPASALLYSQEGEPQHIVATGGVVPRSLGRHAP